MAAIYLPKTNCSKEELTQELIMRTTMCETDETTTTETTGTDVANVTGDLLTSPGTPTPCRKPGSVS